MRVVNPDEILIIDFLHNGLHGLVQDQFPGVGVDDDVILQRIDSCDLSRFSLTSSLLDRTKMKDSRMADFLQQLFVIRQVKTFVGCFQESFE